MTNVRRLSIPLVLGVALLGLVTASSISQPSLPQDSNQIEIAGSSTVFPVTTAVAERFSDEVNPNARINVRSTGSGGGFDLFIPKETDINDSSRAIKASEIERAEANGTELIESIVGFDGLTVALDAEQEIFPNSRPCMTYGELQLLWSAEAEGIVTNYADLGSRFADAEITLSGAAETSGTFDFFTEIVVGAEDDSRADYFKTEEDTQLVERTAENPLELTYFGFAFFVNNQEALTPVAIDPTQATVDAPQSVLDAYNAAREAAGQSTLENSAESCQGIVPSVDSIGAFDYPVTRPLFIYTNPVSAERPMVADFVDFYLSETSIGNEEFMLDVGYVTASRQLREAARQCWADRTTGSAFDGDFPAGDSQLILDLYTSHCDTQ